MKILTSTLALCIFMTTSSVDAVTRMLDYRDRCISSYSGDNRMVIFGSSEEVEEKLSKYEGYSFVGSALPDLCAGKVLTVDDIWQKVWIEIVYKVRMLGKHVGESEKEIGNSIEFGLKRHLNDIIQLLIDLEPLEARVER